MERSFSWRGLFLALALGTIVLMATVSRDYGITNDEYGHTNHGRLVLEYFEGKSQIATIWPIVDGHYQITDQKLEPRPEGGPVWSMMNIFAGSFDLLCEWVYRIFPGWGEYEIRHFFNALFGATTIIMVGLISARLGGWRAGVLGLLFALLSPRIFGHSMNNPKDIPFAALHAFSLYQILLFLLELPQIKWYRPVLIAIGIALTIDVRVGGILLICYFGLFTLLDTLRRGRPYAIKPLAVAAGTSLAAYLLCFILWPAARHSSILAPLQALKLFSEFDIFNAYDLFEGHWINRWEIPWYFLPKWIWITTPLFVSAGVFLIPWIFLPEKAGKWMGPGPGVRAPFAAWILPFAACFPILFIIIKKSNVYADGRHVLFTVPILTALCALGFENLLRRTALLKNQVALPAVVLVLSAFLSEPATWMIRTHPLDLFYFSPLIGGVRGAFTNYELDYWLVAYRSAVEWIASNVPAGTEQNPVRVRVYYGEPKGATYYLDQHPGYKFVVEAWASPNWDYTILAGAEAKHGADLILKWPPQGTVHSVEVDGVPLAAVIKNTPTADSYLQYGFSLLQDKHFAEAIAPLDTARQMHPNDPNVLNNLGWAYAGLEQWDKAIPLFQEALKVQPTYDLARNNLAYAQEQAKKKKK